MATKRKTNLMQIWANAASDKKIVTAESKLSKLPQKMHNSPTSPSSTTSVHVSKASVNPQTSPSDTSSILAKSASETERTGQNTRETPAQNKISQEITHFESKIISLVSLKESGFATDQNLKELNSAKKSLKLARKKLIHLVKDAESQKKRRCERRKAMLELTSVSKEATSKLRKFTREQYVKRLVDLLLRRSTQVFTKLLFI